MHALSLNLSFPLAREFHDGAHGTEFTFAGRIPASPSVMLPSHVRNCARAAQHIPAAIMSRPAPRTPSM